MHFTECPPTIAVLLLDEPHLIRECAVVSFEKLPVHMRSIVHGELSKPPHRLVHDIPVRWCVVCVLGDSLDVAAGAVDNVHWRPGVVVRLLWHVVHSGPLAFVAVHVSAEVNVHAVQVEQGLHCGLQGGGTAGGHAILLLVQRVHGAVATDEDPGELPGCAGGICLGQIGLQPAQLVAEAAVLQAGILVVGRVGVVGLSVDADKVHVLVVEAVPHVLHASSLGGGHAEAVVICL